MLKLLCEIVRWASLVISPLLSVLSPALVCSRLRKNPDLRINSGPMSRDVTRFADLVAFKLSHGGRAEARYL